MLFEVCDFRILNYSKLHTQTVYWYWCQFYYFYR